MFIREIAVLRRRRAAYRHRLKAGAARNEMRKDNAARQSWRSEEMPQVRWYGNARMAAIAYGRK